MDKRELTLNQIAKELGISRQTLLSDRKHPEWQTIVEHRIGELDIQIETMIYELYRDKNPSNKKAALTASLQLRQQITGKSLPNRTENLNLTVDLTEQNNNTKIWRTLLREAPPSIRTYITEHFAEIKNRDT